MRFRVLVYGVMSCLLGCTDSVGPSDSATEVSEILFLGNSVTIHGADPKVGWTGGWGLASTESAKDYAHVLSARFPGATHREINISVFELPNRIFDLATLDQYLTTQPDVIVVQLGDNIATANAPVFASSYKDLVDYIAAHSSGKILCVNTWFNSTSVNAAIQNACVGARMRLVNISDLSAVASNRADADGVYFDRGVGAHPGNHGMQLIADALYSAAK